MRSAGAACVTPRLCLVCLAIFQNLARMSSIYLGASSLSLTVYLSTDDEQHCLSMAASLQHGHALRLARSCAPWIPKGRIESVPKGLRGICALHRYRPRIRRFTIELSCGSVPRSFRVADPSLLRPSRSSASLLQQFRALCIAALLAAALFGTAGFQFFSAHPRASRHFDSGRPEIQLNALVEQSINPTACSFATSPAPHLMRSERSIRGQTLRFYKSSLSSRACKLFESRREAMSLRWLTTIAETRP